MQLVRTAIGLGIFGVAAVAGAGSAEASCAVREWYGTPSGATIPSRGVLYKFNSLDGDSPQMERYDAADGSELVRHYQYRDHEVRFVVDPEWAPPAEAPRVLTIEHAKHEWTCSEENALAIQIDQPVAAVRVFWATSEGQHEMIVAPTPDQTPLLRPASILKLGKIDCAGENVPVADLERGIVLGLTAIRHDGSEIAIDAVPTIVAFGDFAKTRDPAALGFGMIVERPEAAPAEEPWRPRTNGAAPIAPVLGAIVLGARRGIAGARASDVKLPAAKSRR
jgi:hypothetical protein